jgi:hypothetical protein
MFGSLKRAALDYLTLASQTFHEHRAKSEPCNQAIVGTFAIGLELLLKALILRRCPHMVFKKLSKEIELLITHPKVFPAEVDPRQLELILQSWEMDTIDFQETAALTLTLCPGLRDEWQPQLKWLRVIRNCAVHSTRTFQPYHLDRVAFIALSLTRECSAMDDLGQIGLSKKDDDFLASFSSERLERFKTKMDQARRQAKKDIHHFPTLWLMLSRYTAHAHCPVCGSMLGTVGALLPVYDDDANQHPYFEAGVFSCADCGLELDDPEEFRLAGLERYYEHDPRAAWWKSEETDKADKDSRDEKTSEQG